MKMLLPFINETFPGVIWRMEIDSLSETIFLEIRDTADKKVSFASVNLLSGKPNFTGFTTPERWLTGIEAAYNGILLLHNYQSEGAPVHKDIIAVDNKATICWSNYTYAFDHLTINGPVVYSVQIQPKKLFVADIKTGTAIRPYELAIDTEPENYIEVPQILPSPRLKQILPVEPYGDIIHYFEHNNLRIVSLHSLKAEQLKQHLYIIDDGVIVYDDLLNAGIQKLQPESFIIYKNSLIYIKNKSELKVLNL